MRPFAGAVLAFIVGLIVTYIVVAAIGHGLLQGVSDPGGGRAMQIMFLIAPLCALAGGAIAAVVAARSLAHRAQADAAGEPSSKPGSMLTKLALAALAAVILVYLLARVLYGI
jgi:hypothetical protein